MSDGGSLVALLAFLAELLLVPDGALAATVLGYVEEEGPLVMTQDGALLGEWVEARGGATRPFSAFRGIPYAAPPIGSLRFRSPRPAPRWGGIRNATREGPKCPQITVPDKQYTGEEDCLYLNVYTPLVSFYAERLPVMVYIHGGGFSYGSGTIEENGPDFLLENDVILVTLNYRLGALGFLNLDEDGIPGNMGLKDQHAALKWVRNNIEWFGGDPCRVTIFGNSAGAVSVHLHSLVRASRGLFNAAIMQSGNALASFGYDEPGLRTAQRLCQLLGANISSPLEMEKVFRAASAHDIVMATQEMIRTDPVLQTGYPPFQPTPERRKRGSEWTFLDRDPESLMLEPVVPPVPTMAGVSEREGLFALYYPGLNALPSAVLAAAAQNKASLLPRNLPPYADTARLLKLPRPRPQQQALTPEQIEAFGSRIQAEYFGTTNLTEDLSPYYHLLGDLFNVIALHRLATLGERGAKAPLFLYQFNFDGEYNYGKKEFNISEKGATHTDELGYLMRITKPNLSQDIATNSPSAHVLRMVTRRWTEFAKNPCRTDDDGAWQPSFGNSVDAPYTAIGAQFTKSARLGGRWMKLWDDFYGELRTPSETYRK